MTITSNQFLADVTDVQVCKKEMVPTSYHFDMFVHDDRFELAADNYYMVYLDYAGENPLYLAVAAPEEY